MKRLLRLALPSLLLLGPPAWGQSSLGQTGALPPPKPPQSAVAPATAPSVTPPAGPTKPAAPPKPKPPVAPAAPTAAPAKTAPGQTPVVQPKPGVTAGKPAQPAPQSTSAAAAPAKPKAPVRKPAAPAAAGVAAGAAAVGAARPAETAPVTPPPPKPSLGSATNLPLPRFAALGSNQVNLRIGPDLRYKIDWTYQRRDLPVMIVDEHQIWRRIRDPEGTEGWVQRPLLSSRRTFLVQGEERALRRRPEENADPVARLKPGVVGTIRSCETGSAWCEVRVGEYRGWLKRSEIWGVTADEVIN